MTRLRYSAEYSLRLVPVRHRLAADADHCVHDGRYVREDEEDHAGVWGQPLLLNLKEFIFEIEKASGYSFIYGEEIIFKHPITLSLRKAPLSLILQKAFAGQNISFKINKNHIILKKYALQSSKKSFTLNGYVLDSISKETLIGANIYDQKNGVGPLPILSDTLASHCLRGALN